MTIRVNRPREKLVSIQYERRLDPQAVERLPRTNIGNVILCTCGVLWVTQEGDLEDYLLQKGRFLAAGRLLRGKKHLSQWYYSVEG